VTRPVIIIITTLITCHKLVNDLLRLFAPNINNLFRRWLFLRSFIRPAKKKKRKLSLWLWLIILRIKDKAASNMYYLFLIASGGENCDVCCTAVALCSPRAKQGTKWNLFRNATRYTQAVDQWTSSCSVAFLLMCVSYFLLLLFSVCALTQN